MWKCQKKLRQTLKKLLYQTDQKFWKWREKSWMSTAPNKYALYAVLSFFWHDACVCIYIYSFPLLFFVCCSHHLFFFFKFSIYLSPALNRFVCYFCVNFTYVGCVRMCVFLSLIVGFIIIFTVHWFDGVFCFRLLLNIQCKHPKYKSLCMLADYIYAIAS